MIALQIFHIQSSKLYRNFMLDNLTKTSLFIANYTK